LKGPLSPSTVNHITDSSGIPRTFATGLMTPKEYSHYKVKVIPQAEEDKPSALFSVVKENQKMPL